MRKLSVLALGVIAAFVMSTLASAATEANGDGRPPLPAGAVQVSENVYYLGKKKVDGVELEGYALVLRANEHLEVAKRRERGGQGKACQSLLLPHRLSAVGRSRALEGKHRRRASLSLTHHVVGHRYGHRSLGASRRYKYLRLWVERQHRPRQLVSGRAERRGVRRRRRWRHCRCHVPMGIETSRDLRVGHDFRQ